MIRELFDKYQDFIVEFSDTQFGRDYLSQLTPVLDAPIVRVTPDSIHYLTDDSITAKFVSKSKYLGLFKTSLTAIDIAVSNGVNFYSDKEYVIPHFESLITPRPWLPQIYLSEDVSSPDANPESTSVDGVIASGNNTTWATVHDLTTGSIAEDSASASSVQTSFSTPNYSINRGIFLFDTSSIPSSAILSTDTLPKFQLRKNNLTGASDTYGLVRSTPASNTAVVAGDFDAFTVHSDTAAATVAAGSINTGSYTDWDFSNSTYNTWITKGGITKLGLRNAKDYSSTAGHSSPPTDTQNFSIIMADNGSNIPVLTVNYTPVSGTLFYSHI